MPANKNAMTRYALIDRMLANRHRTFSIQDITDELNSRLPALGLQEVTKRCVEKDLNYLASESPFDVEIEEYWIDAADKNDRPYRKRCIRYADSTFSIFKEKLTDDEKTVLSVALDTLGSLEGLENFEWLGKLKTRLKVSDRNPIISISKNILSNSSLIARLYSEIQSRNTLQLHYHTFDSADIKSVNVSPYMIKEYNNRWYLIAAASDSGRILTFGLDRIDGFSISSAIPYLPMPEDLTDRYDDIIGVTSIDSNPLLEIIFWVSDSAKEYVCTKPLHGSQVHLRHQKERDLRHQYPQFGGGAFFCIKCKENYELIRELMSFGPDLIVLEPENIRKAILSRLTAMQQAYRCTSL